MLSSKSLKVTIFITEIICMILELCASYLFSPYFGTANSVWTGIIGVILLSNSVGNYVGGKLAQNKDKNYVPFIFLLSAIFILYIGLFSDIVCLLTVAYIHNTAVGSLITSLILLAPSEICLGTIPPQIMTRTAGYSDKDIGLIYMLSTIGGLTGTFIGGYFLIPNMGVNIIIIVCSVLCIILGFELTKNSKKLFTLIIAIAMLIADIFTVVYSHNNSLILNDVKVYDSEYNRIMVGEIQNEYDGKNMRYMMMAAGFESVSYTDEDMRYELGIQYPKAFAEMIDYNGEHKDKLFMIGGAAYMFPKYVLAHYNENVTIDVVEIDPLVLEIAKKDFYLQDCIDEYDPKGERLGLFINDAKVYIKNCQDKYDIVFNDAFSGTVPIRTLTTKESVQEIKNMLYPDGMYVTNIIGDVDNDNCEFLKAECNTIAQVFKYVYITECPRGDAEAIPNYRVIGTDVKLDMESIDISYDDSIILTDNYCPIDSLLPREK